MPTVTERWLAPLFVGELEPTTRALFAALDETTLEGQLAGALEAGQLAWPELTSDAPRFVGHLAAVLGDDGGPATLTALHASDLYLACACARGDAEAVAILERDFVASLAAPLRATGLATDGVDEVQQKVREFLLVGNHEVPGILNYRGRGPLRSWLRAVAVRQAMMHFRGRRAGEVSDDALHELPAMTESPELAPWKQQYAAAFRAAFEQAIAALDAHQRTLLRQHHIDRLSIDALARLYKIHRATAARWVAAAREALLAGVRERVAATLAISGSELASVFRLARSQLDISIPRLLAKR